MLNAPSILNAKSVGCARTQETRPAYGTLNGFHTSRYVVWKTPGARKEPLRRLHRYR